MYLKVDPGPDFRRNIGYSLGPDAGDGGGKEQGIYIWKISKRGRKCVGSLGLGRPHAKVTPISHSLMFAVNSYLYLSIVVHGLYFWANHLKELLSFLSKI